MTEDKKMFARFDCDDYRNDGDSSQTREVKDLADAAKVGTKLGADFFSTYTQAIVTVGGKTYTGDAEPQTGRHYLKQEKIYTPAEVIAGMTRDAAASAPEIDRVLASLKRHGMGHIADEFTASAATEHATVTAARKEPDTARYAKLRWKGFVKLQDGETAWDAKGNQLWPATATPPAPKIKPNTEFDL